MKGFLRKGLLTLYFGTATLYTGLGIGGVVGTTVMQIAQAGSSCTTKALLTENKCDGQEWKEKAFISHETKIDRADAAVDLGLGACMLWGAFVYTDRKKSKKSKPA